jgi:eukaryotic-like serine/threonine-protein kinase
LNISLDRTPNLSRTTSHSEAELLRPQKAAHKETPLTTDRGLSTEILGQSARRLRVLALIYAFTFFMAGFFPNLLFTEGRRQMVADLAYWVPDIIAIAMALLVALFTRSNRVSLSTVMNVGLAFLVASNYGIAVAEYINPQRLDNFGWQGLSWVAVWTPLFTVVVPTRPRKALIVTLASLSSVPVVIGLTIASGRTIFQPTPDQFFFWIVFPYLLVAILAYVGQSVVYGLGKEVTRAQELGSYRLVERLGEGGMGEVWRAEHRLLARPAAIKLIRPALTTGFGDAATDMGRRFEREAQVTAQLRSPHTVELWDFGIADDGGFYYVMELLDGLDLDKLVKRYGPVSAERAIYLLRQVCHSLGEAETCGLVHRDIKPANIFVCRYGNDYDFVKVLDFGIVKATTTSSSMKTLATSVNVLHGTPAFIAPEQALGVSRVDNRADVYATGCVAYWLLTGQLVFAAETPMDMLLKHAHSVPTPPSARSELPIPPALDDLILACLAKDPAARPQSARELSRRLGEIAGLAPWSEDRAREWWCIHQPVSSDAGERVAHVM